ncbi:tetratricopeptide repeat protein [Arsenicibacter rosenii]|uniref:Uncharacterized protein n=1 Tax=Arsenicibacter rosenii TaxID=1750698 RepID=A0A1S2VD98_9BACT|nr:tetratricopeptide repeat protein [Arsenicibacter rosenii]OIN56683.1 hypothetical protein BLX24_23880 [Arsenicibacter rosenii]
MHVLSIFLLWLAGQQPAGAKPAGAQPYGWTAGHQQAYADLSKLKVQPALQRLAAENSRNGITIWLTDYADMLILLINDDEKAFDQLAGRETQRLDQLRTLPDDSPYARVLQAEVRLHWAFAKLKFGHEISAGRDIIKAFRLLADNQEKYPSFLPTYKALGLLHILFGSVPDNYTWLTNMLGLRGNVRLGLQELERAQHDPLLKNEAYLLELLARSYILTMSPAVSQQLTPWVNSQPDNLLVHYFGATMQIKNGHSEQALAYLNSRPTGPDYLPMPVLNSILGDIYLQQAQYDKAQGAFRRFLSTYRGQSFLKDAYYKLFLSFWLDNEDGKALPYLQKVTSVGKTVAETDKVAQQFAENFAKRAPSANQKVLMKARLAFDGGFLDDALEHLRGYTEARFGSTAEKAEYNYRLGRIRQKRAELPAAIPLFERAISLSEAGQLSFGATSALQLGYLYQQQKNNARARQYFEKALSYKKHEYKNSIDNKARAALNDLGE